MTRQTPTWSIRVTDVALFVVAIAALILFPVLNGDTRAVGPVTIQTLALVTYAVVTMMVFARFLIPYVRYAKASYWTLLFGAILCTLPALGVAYIVLAFSL